ncbi:MAG: hypothetical protein ABW321_29535 [Polyangiales bacterium]
MSRRLSIALMLAALSSCSDALDELDNPASPITASDAGASKDAGAADASDSDAGSNPDAG